MYRRACSPVDLFDAAVHKRCQDDFVNIQVIVLSQLYLSLNMENRLTEKFYYVGIKLLLVYINITKTNFFCQCFGRSSASFISSDFWF